MSDIFGDSTDGPDEVDNPSNPGNDPNFDAGDLHSENDAEAQARQDYDEQVGSDDHETAVSDARHDAGFDDSDSEEE